MGAGGGRGGHHHQTQAGLEAVSGEDASDDVVGAVKAAAKANVKVPACGGAKNTADVICRPPTSTPP
jgi:hypothetical protein